METKGKGEGRVRRQGKKRKGIGKRGRELVDKIGEGEERSVRKREKGRRDKDGKKRTKKRGLKNGGKERDK